MSPIWVLPHRYYFCGFCHVYYAGAKELSIVESPYKDKIEAATNKVEDPIMEDENEEQAES